MSLHYRLTAWYLVIVTTMILALEVRGSCG